MAATLMDLFDTEETSGNKSTGPKTEEGKKAVARNRLTHGLSGAGMLLPHEEAALAVEREEALTVELNATTVTDMIFVKMMAVYATKAESCRRMQAAYRERAMQRAEYIWNGDRRLEALETYRGLKANAEHTVAKLAQTKQGAELMLERWKALGHVLERGQEWTSEHRSMALGLLGIPTEFHLEVMPTIDGKTDEDRRERRAVLTLAQIERLQELIDETLTELDETDRDRTCRGVESLTSPELKLLRRYERDAQRRFTWAWNEFHSLRKTREAEAQTDLTKQTQARPQPRASQALAAIMTRTEPVAKAELPAPANDSEGSESPKLVGNRRYRKKLEALRRQEQKRVARISA